MWVCDVLIWSNRLLNISYNNLKIKVICTVNYIYIYILSDIFVKNDSKYFYNIAILKFIIKKSQFLFK